MRGWKSGNPPDPAARAKARYCRAFLFPARGAFPFIGAPTRLARLRPSFFATESPMPAARPLALALCVALATVLVAGSADAAKKRSRAPAKPASASACSDFYASVDKAWLDANPADPDTGETSALGKLGALAQQQQIDLLNAAMQSPQTATQKLLGDFWASGLDEAAVEANGANPIAPLLKRIDGIRRDRDIAPAIAALHQVGIPVAFDFAADIDLAAPNRYIGYFTQGGFGLRDPAFYTRTDPDARALMARYADYVRKILTLTGTRPDKLEADAGAVIDIETRIAQASRPQQAMQDPRSNYALVEVGALKKQYPHLQLVDFLAAQGVKDDHVSLANTQLFSQLDKLVDTLKPDAWKAYLRYQVGAAMAPYLSKAWRDVDFDFRGRVLRGETAPPSRQRLVLDAINQAGGPILASEYVAKYLPLATRARAEAVADAMRDALSRALDGNAWMSAEAKAQAKAKLANLKIEIGAPAHDPEFDVKPLGRGNFGDDILIASTWRHSVEMRRIGRDNAERRWDVLPQQPSIGYDLLQNRLIVTAAALQAPILDMSADPREHYGALGALIGHELTHAFDAKGRLVDATGALHDWWTPADVAAWNTRTAQVVAQFNGYRYPELTSNVDGELTATENLADIAGLELAWSALSTTQGGAISTAEKQKFFAGWAKLWPQHLTAEGAARLAATDRHAPGQWRTNGPLANLPAFGESFKCKAGGSMQLVESKQTKVWR
jgi:putative endopeptidase